MEDSIKVPIIIAVIAIIAGAIYYFYTPEKVVAPEEPTLGEKMGTQLELNPVENLPETNPFEAETNPFKNGYKNPFKR